MLLFVLEDKIAVRMMDNWNLLRDETEIHRLTAYSLGALLYRSILS